MILCAKCVPQNASVKADRPDFPACRRFHAAFRRLLFTPMAQPIIIW
jgi:hypothetical protein